MRLPFIVETFLRMLYVLHLQWPSGLAAVIGQKREAGFQAASNYSFKSHRRCDRVITAKLADRHVDKEKYHYAYHDGP